MPAQFQMEPLPREAFSPYFQLDDEALRARSARWLVADSKPGFPCRVSLEDAEVGERVLAVSYLHHDVQTPYRASGPIFVREKAQTARLSVGEIPLLLRHRELSLRAYDSNGTMIDAMVLQGVELEPAIVAFFENPDVAYQHVHNAKPGCFACSVHRAEG